MKGAKVKALEVGMRFYLKDLIKDLPLKWADGVVKKMIEETSDEPTERLKQTLKITISSAKEEEREEIIEELTPFDIHMKNGSIITLGELIKHKLKKKHNVK